MFDYITVSIDHYNKIKNDVEFILNQETNNPTRLSKNYTLERFLQKETLAVSVVYKDGIPMDISTAYTRPFYNNGCRLTTRLLVNQDLRTKGLHTIPDTIFTMMAQQLYYVIANYNFDYVFVSREFNTHKFVKKYCEGAIRFTHLPWRYELKRYATFDAATPDEYQWVTWAPLKKIDTLPLPYQ